MHYFLYQYTAYWLLLYFKRDYDDAFLCYCWFLFIPWWGCWYTRSQCQAPIQKFFKGGVEEEKCLLIHVSTHVHIKTTQTYNSFSLLTFQEDCLLFFALFDYSLLLLKGRGGCNPRNPPSRSANECRVSDKHLWANISAFLFQTTFLHIGGYFTTTTEMCALVL